jgi:hypothetical protein
VFGKKFYKEDALDPYKVAVDHFETVPSRSESLLFEIKGLAPNLTGEEGTMDFVRRIRDEWK